MKQQSLAMAADQIFEQYRKPTRREELLRTMEVIVPWTALCEVIEPYYPKAVNGGLFATLASQNIFCFVGY